MKQKRWSIGFQLILGLGILVASVVVLGWLSWRQGDLLWQETKGMYEHPLQVRRAIGEIRADILSIALNMKEMFLADSEPERETILMEIEEREAHAFQQFTTLYESYLGPKSDIDSMYFSFRRWRSIREKTQELFLAGEREAAEQRAKITGVQGVFLDHIMSASERISKFQIARGDRFYADALQHRNDLLVRLGVAFLLIVLLSVLISFWILQSVRKPLREMVAATELFRQGETTIRVGHQSTREFNTLATSFNELAGTIQSNLQQRTNIAKVANIMLTEDDLPMFCKNLLVTLMDLTQSEAGAVYLLDDSKDLFEPYDSIGLRKESLVTFPVSGNEGEFGMALSTKQIQYIQNIPADTQFVFLTVIGQFVPREIVTIPILSGNDVVAVISLSSIRSYPDASKQLISDSYDALSSRFNQLLSTAKMRYFSQKLQEQNVELEAQSMELMQQRNEISEQNTRLELQKNELNEANKLKSNFLSKMSHELRTPLNSILSLSGVLIRRLQSLIPSEELNYLHVISRNGKGLLEVINDILDISRIEAGKEEVFLESFYLTRLMEDVTGSVAPLAKEQKLDLVFTGIDPGIRVTSDFDKCRHVLLNLISNAIKFTPQGKVAVSVEPSNERILIHVSDTGIGIEPEKLPCIFDEFRQADETISRKYGGSGLGLAIAKKYATLIGGDISVESVPGKGSRFTFDIPANREPEPVDGAETVPKYTMPEQQPGLNQLTPKTILVVEDSEPAIIQLQDILVPEKYRVQVAHDGREALELLGKQAPDAVILDLMMPEVDGFQLLGLIRSSAATRRLPVLILTAKHLTKEELSFLKGNNIHQLIRKGDVSRIELLHYIRRMFEPEGSSE